MYMWLIVLKTRPDSQARVKHIKILFIVIFVAFFYLWYQCYELVCDIFTEDKLPDAKNPNTDVTMNYWIMSIATIFDFLVFSIVGLTIVYWFCIMAKELYERRQEANHSFSVVSSLKQLAAGAFGDNSCAICTEEYKSTDMVV